MITYVLTDIEGTTTDIRFVQDVLFPDAYQKLPAFVSQQLHHPQVQSALRDVQHALEAESLPSTELEHQVQALLQWIKEDRKHPALKQLQGLIWQEGYESGRFQGHVYPDVAPALMQLQGAGIQLGVYSSGSIAAQQLLFGYSTQGDLRPFFSHYFDTGIGAKREPQSYTTILEIINHPPEQVLFLSDIPAELDAAQVAGMRTRQLLRPGTLASVHHLTLTDFGGLHEALAQA